MTKHVIYCVLLVAFGLLMFRLDAKSLSGDEWGNVQIEGGTLEGMFAGMATAWSQHPPGSHLIMHAWIKIAGATDFAVRFPGVCWAVVGAALLYALGRRWFTSQNMPAAQSKDGANEPGSDPSIRIALIAALLFGIAPDLILYGRMEKYYSLVVALTLASNLWFDGTVRRPGPRRFFVQGLFSLAILYTDYFAALFVVGAQNILTILIWRREPANLRGWLASQVVAALLFMPFVGVALGQVSSVAVNVEADLASGWKAIAAKLAYFPYAYSVGETIFPWMPSAIIGVILYGVLGVMGMHTWLYPPYILPSPPADFPAMNGDRRQRWAERLTSPGVWSLAFLITPIAGSILLTSVWLKTVPLITLPNHVLFALPFFALLIASGIDRLGRWRALAVAAAVISIAPSLFNYYTDAQFHNPVFITPSRHVLRFIVEKSLPGDVAIADEASGVAYYSGQWNVAQPQLLAHNFGSDPQPILQQLGERVWLVSVGRDRTRLTEPDPLQAWLEQNYRLVETTGFAEQDETYRSLKTSLTGRPAYRYRVVVQLFARP